MLAEFGNVFCISDFYINILYTLWLLFCPEIFTTDIIIFRSNRQINGGKNSESSFRSVCINYYWRKTATLPVTRIFGTTRVPLLFANQQKITLQQRHAATTLLHKSRLIFACGNSHLASAGPLLCLFYDYDGREHRPRMLYRNLIFAML